jgi:hypothetical protein
MRQEWEIFEMMIKMSFLELAKKSICADIYINTIGEHVLICIFNIYDIIIRWQNVDYSS